jgi:hypothetical protein
MLVKNIHTKIHEIHNQKVMLDFDLAILYEIETRVLNQAVKRNLDRYPEDFMFQLTKEEYNSLKSQIVILAKGQHSKYLPFTFTEQGVAMLSSVLKSKKADQVNSSIMHVFVAVKQLILGNEELTKKLNELEAKYNNQFKDVYEALNYLMGIKKEEEKNNKRVKIGYKN